MSNAEEFELNSIMQSLNGIGPLKVTRSKDCTGYKWRVEWFYGGNRQPIQVKKSKFKKIINIKKFINR